MPEQQALTVDDYLKECARVGTSYGDWPFGKGSRSLGSLFRQKVGRFEGESFVSAFIARRIHFATLQQLYTELLLEVGQKMASCVITGPRIEDDDERFKNAADVAAKFHRVLGCVHAKMTALLVFKESGITFDRSMWRAQGFVYDFLQCLRAVADVINGCDAAVGMKRVDFLTTFLNDHRIDRNLEPWR